MTRARRQLPYIVAFLAGCTSSEVPDPVLPPLPPKKVVTETPRGVEAQVRQLTIALTGAVRGEITACGCPTVPYGGFARRAVMLDGVRAAHPTLLQLDAGQMFVKGEIARDPVDRGARARTVLGLAEDVGVDVMAASRVDLAVDGGAPLRSAGALAANWEGWPVAETITRDGLRVQVFGVADAPVAPETPRDPLAAIRSVWIPGMDAYLLLSSAEDAENLRLAEALPELGAVLATKGAHADPPRTTLGAPIIETPDRGRYVTLLHVALGSTAGPWQLDSSGAVAHVAQLRARVTTAPDDTTRATLERQRAAAEEKLREAARGRNLLLVADIPLGSTFDGDKRFDAALADLRDRTVQAAQAVATTPSGPRHAGVGACASCHSDRMAQWAFDPHARALDPLVKAQKTADTECVGCHTTGFGAPGGFSDLAEVSRWKGVQCEACHGPMGGHPADRSVNAAPITVATCTGCHDEANSPSFDFPSYLARISCTTASKMDAQRR